ERQWAFFLSASPTALRPHGTTHRRAAGNDSDHLAACHRGSARGARSRSVRARAPYDRDAHLTSPSRGPQGTAARNGHMGAVDIPTSGGQTTTSTPTGGGAATSTRVHSAISQLGLSAGMLGHF